MCWRHPWHITGEGRTRWGPTSTQEASGNPQGNRAVFEIKWAKTIVFYCRKRREPSRVREKADPHQVRKPHTKKERPRRLGTADPAGRAPPTPQAVTQKTNCQGKMLLLHIPRESPSLLPSTNSCQNKQLKNICDAASDVATKTLGATTTLSVQKSQVDCGGKVNFNEVCKSHICQDCLNLDWEPFPMICRVTQVTKHGCERERCRRWVGSRIRAAAMKKGIQRCA